MSGKIQKLFDKFPFIVDILNEMSETVGICDENGNIVFLNKASENLDGYVLESVRGQSVIGPYGMDIESSPFMRAHVNQKRYQDELFNYRSIDGKNITRIANSAPIYMDGEYIGTYSVQRDVSAIQSVISDNIDLQKQLLSMKRQSPFGKKDIDFTMLGQDTKFVESKARALAVAKTNSSVMLIASTGCGKEMFAKYIHEQSDRRDKPFLALNCAAIPETLLESILFGTTKGSYTGATEREGLFEQTAGGTLFLDEVNSMPLSSQAKLLRVLEDKVVRRLGGKTVIKTDVRIISSCNVDVQEAMAKKQLRTDLFYRLAVVDIRIPPLSQRRDDIYILADHFISQYNDAFGKHVVGLDTSIRPLLYHFDWPGNVRQLKHCIEAAMHFVAENETHIQKKHLPSYLLSEIDAHDRKQEEKTEVLEQKRPVNPLEGGVDIQELIRQSQKKEIIEALIATNGNVTKAAKMLNIGRNALQYRMKKYHLTKRRSDLE